MSNDDDDPPDPMHERGGLTGPLIVLLGVGVLLVLALIAGGVAVTRFRSVDRAREAAVRAEAEQLYAEQTARSAADGEQRNPFRVTLSTVSVEQAQRLAGRRVLIDFDLLNDDGRGGFVVYENDGPDSDEANDVKRTVWVPRGMAVEPKDTALGTIAVIRHAAAVGADGTAFPAFVEVRAVLEG